MIDPMGPSMCYACQLYLFKQRLFLCLHFTIRAEIHRIFTFFINAMLARTAPDKNTKENINNKESMAWSENVTCLAEATF